MQLVSQEVLHLLGGALLSQLLGRESTRGLAVNIHQQAQHLLSWATSLQKSWSHLHFPSVSVEKTG